MKKQLSLLFTALGCAMVSLAQFSSPAVRVSDDQHTSAAGKLYKGIGLDTIACNADTLQYGRYKASSLRAINVSRGYSLGQFYNAPGRVEISGFTLYAWVSQSVSDSVELICRVYEADSDSLPKGKLLQTERIKVDSSFGGGLLSVLEKHIRFDSTVVTDKPFILVIESDDTTRVGVVCNDWISRDGEAENLACGTVGGTWYRCLNLNIGGNALDCDLLLEPHVSYGLSADFSFKDCYNFRDSVRFLNTSSGFLFDPMYNRWAFSNNTRFSCLWNYGNSFGTFYALDGATRYSSAANYDVRLIVQLLHFKNATYCIDTIVKTIHFQPSNPGFSGINSDSLCSGDSALVYASSDGSISWYRNPQDTAFLSGKAYQSGPLMMNDTFYVQAVNAQCSSQMIRKIIKVNETPKLLSVKNDSVCLNSIANLSAQASIGTLNWYTSLSSSLPFYTGDVYTTGNLNSNATYYVEANNNNCLSGGRQPVTAYVSSSFAPSDPAVVRDTIVCLLDGNLVITAKTNGIDTIRWYDVPSGGTPFLYGETLPVTVNKLGRQTYYVDAFDGNCASSRLQVNVRTFTFPQSNYSPEEINSCEGDDIEIDLKVSDNGTAYWYDSENANTAFLTSPVLKFDQYTGDTIIWYQPSNGFCSDTMRHRLKITAHPYGILGNGSQTIQLCSGKPVLLSTNAQKGEIIWYTDSLLSTELGRGGSLSHPGLNESTVYYFLADNQGCRSLPEKYEVNVLPSANALFDFSIIEPGSYQFAARVRNQGFYRWNFGDGSTDNGATVNHAFKKNGDYNVVLVVQPQNGCNDTFTRVMSVNGLASADQMVQTTMNIRAYPNPFGQTLHLKDENSSEINYFELSDLQGRVLITNSFTGKIEVPTTNLLPGMYLLSVRNQSKIITMKLLHL